MTNPTAAPVRTALYRLYAAGETLLYVGITKRLGTRWGEHAKTQTWWPLVDHQTVQWLPSRDKARAAEEAAIATEGAVFNIAGAPTGGWILDEGTGFYVAPKRLPRPRPHYRDELPPAYPGDGWRWPYEQIADDIEAAIRSGELGPGALMSSEQAIMAETGSRRSAVRHAMALLRERGLLYTRPQRGSFVTMKIPLPMTCTPPE